MTAAEGNTSRTRIADADCADVIVQPVARTPRFSPGAEIVRQRQRHGQSDSGFDLELGATGFDVVAAPVTASRKERHREFRGSTGDMVVPGGHRLVPLSVSVSRRSTFETCSAEGSPQERR